jgi:hypothetical protein
MDLHLTPEQEQLVDAFAGLYAKQAFSAPSALKTAEMRPIG